MTNIKKVLIALVAISLVILVLLFLQDGSKKLEDRSYKEINNIVINGDVADITFHKSEDEKVRVVVTGSKKDIVELIEGTKSLIINQTSKNSFCIFRCSKEIEVYLPDNFLSVNINSNVGDISSDNLTINNVLIKNSVGDISLYKTNIVDITSDVGDVFIKEIKGTGDSKIISNVGDIEIDKIINLNLDVKSDIGDKVIPVIKDKQEYTLKIETNVGDIDIDSYDDKS